MRADVDVHFVHQSCDCCTLMLLRHHTLLWSEWQRYKILRDGRLSLHYNVLRCDIFQNPFSYSVDSYTLLSGGIIKFHFDLFVCTSHTSSHFIHSFVRYDFSVVGLHFHLKYSNQTVATTFNNNNTTHNGIEFKPNTYKYLYKCKIGIALEQSYRCIGVKNFHAV